MKVQALALALAFGGLQTVAYTDCGCREVCAGQQGGSCGGAGQAPHEEGGCCGPSKAAPSGCVHVHPSSEVVVHAPAADAVPPTSLAQPAAPDLPQAEAGLSRNPPAPARPIRGRPLYLLLSSLLL